MDDFLDALRRSRPLLLFLTGVSGLILVALFLHHVLGLGRDDRYVTRRVNERLAYTAPALAYNATDEYQLFLHTGEVLGAPAPRPATAVASTYTVTVTGAAGAVLLPGQPLTFTFTEGLYLSYPVTFVNDFADTAGPGREEATIYLATPGGAATLTVRRETTPQSWARRLITDFLGAAVLATMAPAILVLLGALATVQRARRDEQIRDLAATIGSLVSGSARESETVTLELKAEAALRALGRDSRALGEEHATTYRSSQALYQNIYPLLKALRGHSFIRSDELLAAARSTSALASAGDALAPGLGQELVALLQDLASYDERARAASGPPLGLSYDAPFFGERLAYLGYKGLLDQISSADIDRALQAHEASRLLLDQRYVQHFRRLRLIKEQPLPPVYLAQDQIHIEQLKVQIPVLLPFPLDPLLALEQGNRPLLITGPTGSGKTTTLDLLQRVKRERGALYLEPIAASRLGSAPLKALPGLVRRALLTLLNEKPAYWLHLREAAREHRRPIPPILAGRAPAEGGADDELLALALLGDMLQALGLNMLCVAVDDAPPHLDELYLQQQLERHIPCQVFLRVALQRPPAASSPGRTVISLNWTAEALEQLLDNIRPQYQPGWTPEVGQERLLALAHTPGELVAWLYAIQKCYHNDDLRMEDWARLVAAMGRARAATRPGQGGWQIGDAEAALRTLKVL